MDTNIVYNYCSVRVGDIELPADLVLLDMRDFNVTLHMDWLVMYHATVDYFSWCPLHLRINFLFSFMVESVNPD